MSVKRCAKWFGNSVREAGSRVALGAALSMMFAAAAHADVIERPAVPGTIDPPAVFKPFLVGHAVGTQNYMCVSVGKGFEWKFIGPQATIFDASAEQILTHFQSRNPIEDNAIDATWLHSRDTSAVWARKVKGSTDPDYVAPGAVEWLLLAVSGAQQGPTGGTRLSGTQFIQRVNTVGGVAPSTGECNGSTVNTRRLVSYEADYYFYQ